MGCISRIGCFVLGIVVALGAWFTRDLWMPRVLHRAPAAAVAAPTWQPMTDAGAKRAQDALDRLSQPTGRSYESLSPADVAAFVTKSLGKQLPSSADSIETMVSGDRILVRARVKTSELGGAGVLGPLAALFGDYEHVEMGGTMRVVRPGLGELQVLDLKVKNLDVPHGLIPQIISRLTNGKRLEGVAADALPLPLPKYIGDIRVTNGKITLYKAQ